MKLFIDSADLEKDQNIIDYYSVDGITTNPKILADCEIEEKEILPTIKEFVVKNNILIFVQVTGETADEMVKQATTLKKCFGEALIVKIPAVKEGYKAVKRCKSEGIKVCVTVIHSTMQAFVAAKAGADYVAPYISHIDNLGGDGVASVEEMLKIFRNGEYSCEVLGASFRTVDQVKRLAVAGCDAVTITPEMFEMLIAHSATDQSMIKFSNAWRDKFGDYQVDNLL